MADWRAGCLDRSDLAPVDNKLESTIGNMQYPYNRLERFLSPSLLPRILGTSASLRLAGGPIITARV
jgi:hypothetical protein